MARNILRLPNYTWEPDVAPSGRYRSETTGRFVSSSAVNNALEIRLNESSNIITRLSHRLANQEISIAEWQNGMADETKIAKLLAGASEAGGANNLTPANLKLIEDDVRNQLDFLQRFAKDIEDGKVNMRRADGEVNGNFVNRAKRYGLEGRSTASNIRAQGAQENGLTQVMRVLANVDHCKTSKHRKGCVVLAGIWVDIDSEERVPIGGATCGPYCRCGEEWR